MIHASDMAYLAYLCSLQGHIISCSTDSANTEWAPLGKHICQRCYGEVTIEEVK